MRNKTKVFWDIQQFVYYFVTWFEKMFVMNIIKLSVLKLTISEDKRTNDDVSCALCFQILNLISICFYKQHLSFLKSQMSGNEFNSCVKVGTYTWTRSIWFLITLNYGFENTTTFKTCLSSPKSNWSTKDEIKCGNNTEFKIILQVLF